METNELPAPLESVHLTPMNWTLSHFTDDGGRDVYDLDAPYQRESVWTYDQRVALIKSILLGVPIGAVITSEVSHENYGNRSFLSRVLDGKQRIETIRIFSNDGFTIPGWWISDDWIADPALRSGDIVFSQFSDAGRRFFENRPFPALKFDATTESTENPEYDPVKAGKPNCPPKYQKWICRGRSDVEIIAIEAELYALINNGGTAHTAEQLAHAADVATKARKAVQ